MKKIVPDWLIQSLWFLAGICATGAFWYFLSKNDVVFTLLSAVGTLIFSSLAIYHHRLNDRHSRNLVYRTKLAGFVEESQRFRGRFSETPLPIQDFNDWSEKVSNYLRDNFDASYVVRFGDFTGMMFYGDGSELSRLKKALDGRTRRLHEFLGELN